jgi:hypothetical protein
VGSQPLGKLQVQSASLALATLHSESKLVRSKLQYIGTYQVFHLVLCSAEKVTVTAENLAAIVVLWAGVIELLLGECTRSERSVKIHPQNDCRPGSGETDIEIEGTEILADHNIGRNGILVEKSLCDIVAQS